MTYVVSFDEFALPERFDNVPWNQLKISESATGTGSWSVIDTQEIDPPANDPSNPDPISFTTENATLQHGWYKIQFLAGTAGDAGTEETDPIFNAPPNFIMADLDDINMHLDGSTFRATANNTNLIQISVARMIRGYLSRAVDTPTLNTWITPITTPDIIREIAGRFIAAQLYVNQASRTSMTVDDKSFAQFKYNEAIAMLNQIIAGTITIPDITETTDETITIDDFFPIDNTDRAFTVGMNLN